LDTLYISLLIIFAAFGAFCFNMGHRRAYRVVLKSLLKGQIDFLSGRISSLNEKGDGISQDGLSKAYYSYETIGQLVIAWYRYFALVRDDKELRTLKSLIKRRLEEYLVRIEAAGGVKKAE
jgi:hypothetical protein